ncbi:Nuclear hormone receptor family member nhr-49 [Aphelenchoides fujianensis]|nr:Nuclear hormone receptor family member nhr-49 [Aphelenchoides fujianensis]
MNEMDDELEHLGQNEEPCAVCGDTADGFHYSILSCRGCNAFFRRAITYNLQFQCRRGGQCIIDKNARCACRYCRLQKCLQVGMDRSAVQPRRQVKTEGSAGDLVPAPSASRTSDSGSMGESCKSSPQSTIGSPTTGLLTPACNINTSTKNGMNGGPSSSSGNTCALTRMVEDYCEQRRRRRAMLCSTLEEILSDEAETRLKGPATPDDLSTIYRVQMILMFEWAEKLDDFKAVQSPHDKAKLLRVFSMKFLLLDNLFHTIELNATDRIVLVNNKYVKYENPPPTNGNESPAMQKMYGEMSVSILEELVRPMIEMNITRNPRLRLIIFYNPGSVGLTPETTEQIHRASERAIKELHNWFDENNVSEVKTRLANLLLLLGPISKHTQNLTDLAALIPDFGALNEWDSFMNDLLR